MIINIDDLFTLDGIGRFKIKPDIDINKLPTIKKYLNNNMFYDIYRNVLPIYINNVMKKINKRKAVREWRNLVTEKKLE